MSRNVQIVTIEGNIGSGKSTLLEKIVARFETDSRIVFIEEPVREWGEICDEEGTPMLQKFYGDQKTYSFPFQMMAYITRLAKMKTAIRENPDATIFVTERSLYTDKHVFAKMLYDMNNIEHVNYQIYTRWFDNFAEDYPINKVVYVKANPQTCHERINERSRTGEDSIPIGYLETCHEYHEKMIQEDFANMNVLTIDGNQNIRNNPEILEDWLKTIDAFALQQR